MPLDSQTLNQRKYQKVAALEAQYAALQEDLKTAQNTDLHRIRGLLVATERRLKWHRPRLPRAGGPVPGVSAKTGHKYAEGEIGL